MNGGRRFRRAEARFRDRAAAGAELAAALSTGEHAAGGPSALERPVVVLALPRGGVPVATPVARALAADLDAVIVRKLRAPGRPELAMGALARIGGVTELVRHERVIAGLAVDEAEFDRIVARESAELSALDTRYRGSRSPPLLTGREVVLVDDGLATGATMLAAVRLARRLGAAGIIVAVPTGAVDAIGHVRRTADRVVVLDQPSPFIAVSLSYADFTSPSDESIRSALNLGAS